VADGVAELREENSRLRAENVGVRAENAELLRLVTGLNSRVAELEAKLGETSGNSSRPPSSDPNTEREKQKQTRAERRREARRQGKQPGAEGRNLSQVSNPDRREVHRPEECSGCGAGLGGGAVVGSKTRQVFDLPPVRVEVTEHVAVQVRCACGCVTTGAFPAEATAPACWGPGVRALGIYLTHRQHLPVLRAAELMSHSLGAPVSTGFLSGLAGEAARRLTPFMARTKELLARNPVVNTDETSIRVSAKSWWLHVIATPMLTLLVCHRSRGRDAIEDMDVLPGYGGVIVHDGLSTYDNLDDAVHAQCGAHLVRHAARLHDHDDTRLFARLMTEALLDAATAARKAAEQGRPAVPATSAARLRARYRHAIDVGFRLLPPGSKPRLKHTGGWKPHQRDAWNLATRFRDDEADILRFLTDTAIPFTNNNAERPLRPAKLHDKISGSFRNPDNAGSYATILSYLGTAAKHGRNLHDTLVELFTTGPWLPPDAIPG